MEVQGNKPLDRMRREVLYWAGTDRKEARDMMKLVRNGGMDEKRTGFRADGIAARLRGIAP